MTFLLPRAGLALVLAVLLAGCSLFDAAEETEPTFSTEQIQFSYLLTSAEAGDSATMQLVNGSTTSINYNLCHTDLQVLVEEAWQRVATARPEDTICMDHQIVLAAGTGTMYVWGPFRAALAPGRYRFVTTIEHRSVRTEIPSNEFLVPDRS